MTELLILQSLAYHAQKDLSSALEALEKSVALAWPEDAIRVFLDEGEPMARLCYQAKARGANPRGAGDEFVERILSHFGLLSGPQQPAGVKPLPARPVPHPTGLVDPLSARELEVLRAIAEGCSNQEIADRFVLSPKTVKRHISNIYAKLEAKNRTQAVALARSLKLIA